MRERHANPDPLVIPRTPPDEELDALRNFMEKRHGKPVMLVAGAAIVLIEALDDEITELRKAACRP